MKKLLSLLLALGLTATTSTAVVSCTTKKVTITFQDLASINSATWKAAMYGAFFTADLGDATIGDKNQPVKVIQNKFKLAAYTSASFNNYSTAYNKIMNENTVAVVLRKQPYSNEYVPALTDEELADRENLFVKFMDPINQLTATSAILPLNFFAENGSIFNLENWLASPSPVSIKISDVETSADEQNPFGLTSVEIASLVSIKESVINDFHQIKKGSSWPIADRAINDFLNYFGEYLVRCEKMTSDYSAEQAPVTIKQQLKSLFSNSEQKLKDEARKLLIEDWAAIDDSVSGISENPLVLSLVFAEKPSIDLKLDFSE